MLYINKVSVLRRLAQQPSEGVFYIINYGNGNELEFFLGSSAAHIDVWQQVVVPKLVAAYGLNLTSEEMVELQDSHTAFPRGRVTKAAEVNDNIQIAGEKAGHWYIYVSSPDAYSNKVQINIINAFGLNKEAARELVIFTAAKHERCDLGDVKTVRTLFQKRKGMDLDLYTLFLKENQNV